MKFAYLPKGKFREELLRLVGLAKDKLRIGLDAGTGVLGGDQSLVGPEVVRVGVQSLKQSIFISAWAHSFLNHILNTYSCNFGHCWSFDVAC